MALFQTSVLKTYLAQQDTAIVERAYKKYTAYFHNPVIQENIKNAKEEQYQAKFLDELFVDVLGFTLNPKPDFNITTEFKNQKGAGKADGAILKDNKALGVIELKGTNTKDLESIRKQAFDYKANQKGCVYVITSNFEKLRFYINDATEFLEFNLFQLAPEEFALMYLCLQKDNILNQLPLTIKEASLVEEDKITKQFYNDYSVFKRELFRDLVKRNAKRLKAEVVTSSAVEMSQEANELKALEKNVKLSLFKKSQKLIDRFLFIFFAEDRDLLPPNSTIQILDKWKADIDFGDERPLYNLFKQYFHFLDEGRKGTTSRAEIYAYNGGLFKPDAILDNLEIDDELLYKHAYKLAKYDFSSQVDVNILGHIFENSLNEIESVNAEIEGGAFDKQKSKRKKDGVFYTPKYITKYIVENTVGKLCQEKKDQLGFKEEAYFEIKKGTHQNTKKQLLEVLDSYREWLLQITICDPACGSGAFLNQALDFLIKEHRYIDELKAKVLGGGLILSDIENTILENNIYGVDLNEESVEIAKLSLWLRTAQPRRKLNDLSNNIKCGNSLIDDKKVAGDKAFNWQEQFPQVFREKDKHAYHLVFTTHNSRWSKRMIDQKIKKGPPLELNLEQEIALTQIIKDIVLEKGYSILAYNICKDHVHLVLVCEAEEVVDIAKTVKGKSSYLYQSKGFKPLGDSLWSQKFFFGQLDDFVWAGVSPLPGQVFVDRYLDTAISYVKHNRAKHKLPASAVLNDLISEMLTEQNTAFDTEYSGGFDVVIGNPPYGVTFDDKSKKYLTDYDKLVPDFEIYIYFISLYRKILKAEGFLSYIFPNTFLSTLFGKKYRDAIFNEICVDEIVDLSNDNTFVDASVRTIIFSFRNTYGNYNTIFTKVINKSFVLVDTYNKKEILKESENVFNLFSQTKDEKSIINKIQSGEPLNTFFNVSQGLIPYDKYRGHDEYTIKNRIWHSNFKKDETFKKELKGGDVFSYRINWSGNLWISYGDWLAAPREPKYFTSKRVLIREITSSKLQCCYTEEEYYNTPSLINVIDLNKKLSLKYLLTILNSNLIGWYHNKTSPKANKGLFPKILVNDVRKIPLVEATEQEQKPFVDKADFMLSINNEFNNLTVRFQNYLINKFNLDKLSRKLENWYELNFADFIKELNKAIKKAGGTALTKKDEFEWLELFEDNKKKAQELQNQITQTEKEIDTMVYDLYGLTEEEREIVENS